MITRMRMIDGVLKQMVDDTMERILERGTSFVNQKTMKRKIFDLCFL